MQITVGFKDEHDPLGRLVDVQNIEELSAIITKEHYSLSIFKNNYRSKKNFIRADAIALDFDKNYTIDQALVDFADYSHIIAPSRSHRKEKDGVTSDRFRVVLFLSDPIDNADTFTATWHSLAKNWPDTDRACKDASRFWFASSGVVSIKKGGLKVKPVEYTPEVFETKPERIVPEGKRGELGRPTFKFLLDGVESGGRNDATMKAARDFQQNLYPVEEAIDRIVTALNLNGTISRDFPEREVENTIRSVYRSDAKHEPRLIESAFFLQPISSVYKATEDAKIEWLMDGKLQVGGVSLLSADPKAGKSVIARQLCAHVLTGTPFFGRAIKQGACHYYGIEEHPMILAKSFQRLGIPANADLLVHAGDPLTEENVFKDFAEGIIRLRPALAVVDTAFDLLEVESENNYREVKKAFKAVRKVARESGTHIMLIHHNGKPQKDFRQRGNHAVLGSTAISAGVDSILIIEMDGRARMISTSGREVDPWHRRLLKWNPENATYSLGSEKEEEF